MKKSIILAILIAGSLLCLDPATVLAQTSCPQSFTTRVQSCPGGASTCTTKGSSLTWAELDNDILNTVGLCDTVGQFEWPAPSAGQLISSSSGGISIVPHLVFNVRDPAYGAMGDNSNDDTAEIQAAIDAAEAAGGGRVYIPRGIYRVSSALVSNTNAVVIEGDGPGNTVIRATSTTADVVTFGNAAAAYSPCGGLSRLSIDSSVTRTTGAAVVLSGCEYGRLDNLRIHTTGGNGISIAPGDTFATLWFIRDSDIEISGAFTGISIGGGNDRYFSGLWIRGTSTAGSYGISITKSAGDWFDDIEAVLFEQGVSATSTSSGSPIQWLTLQNVLSDTNTLVGFNFTESGTGIIQGIDCIACWSSTNGAATINGRGFVFSGVTGVKLVSPRIINNGGHGIEAASVADFEITGGWATGNSQASSGTAHGVIFSSSSGVRVHGLRSGQTVGQSNTQGYGLFINTGTDNYSLVGNDLRTNVSGGLNNVPGLASTRIAYGNLPLTIANESFPYSAGVAGGQTITGGTGASENLKLVSTSNSTRGEIQASANTAALPAHGASGTVFHVGGADSTPARSLLDAFNSNASVDFRASTGTAASPTALGATNNMGQIGWFGRGATAYTTASRAAIRAITNEAWSDSAQGTFLSFLVTANGSASSAEKFRLDGSGNLGLNGAATFGTSATGNVVLLGGTAPTASPTDVVALWVGDSAAGDANLYARNEVGISEQLTGLRKRVKTQFDKTDTTLATVTDLTFNVEAGKAYGFTAWLPTTANAAGGVKFAISGTATATSVVYDGDLNNAGVITTSRATSLGTAVCNVTAATAGTCRISGAIVVNAAGTLVVQFAQNASNGSASSVLLNAKFFLEPIGN